jgi:hypothetical protein
MALRRGQEALADSAGGTLVRSDPGGAGIRRRRHGRGFSYLGPDATVVKDHPEGSCDAQPWPAGVRVPGQGRQTA